MRLRFPPRTGIALVLSLTIGAATYARPGTGAEANTFVERIGAEDVPIDLSFLNADDRPAGQHGFLRAVGERLVFADGRAAHFWGVNITAYALFSTSEDSICRQANRLAALGINLVRLHHHDSPWVSPNVFGPASDTLTLDPQSMRRLDRWISCLKGAGVYTWLDLEVGRAYVAADGIDDFADIAKGQDRVHGAPYAYVNASIRKRMQEFSEAYLGHVNAFTGLAYKDDPAVAFVLITNENDMTQHFGNALLPSAGSPRHSQRYMEAAARFASEHKLDPQQTWKAWEHGPAKLFLNDLEHRFNAEMIRHLRSIGVKALVATTSYWGNDPLASLPALTDGDIIDAHTYADPGFLQRGPDEAPGPVHWIASGAVKGKPVTVSEWNTLGWPSADRGALPLWIASIGALQGWDAMLEFAYAQGPPDDQRPANQWEFYNDPVLLTAMPAAALLFRRTQFEGMDTVEVQPDRYLEEPVSAQTSTLLKSLPERQSMALVLPSRPELPWFKGQQTVGGPKLDEDARTAPSQICSTPAFVCRDFGSGTLTISNTMGLMAAGMIGGRTLDGDGVAISVDSPDQALVAVQSLTDEPLRTSRRILISFAGQSIPTGSDPPAMRTNAVSATVRLAANPGLKVFSLDSAGRRSPAVMSFSAGQYQISVTPSLATHWMLLER
ncbi:MAG: hypothetical protein U1E46_15900 [Hyphomicrobiales bacterium]